MYKLWCRWNNNWIIHLDGMFQTFDRLGDHNVHVARGMRRLVIMDTMADVQDGYLGAPTERFQWNYGFEYDCERWMDEFQVAVDELDVALLYLQAWKVTVKVISGSQLKAQNGCLPEV